MTEPHLDDLPPDEADFDPERLVAGQRLGEWRKECPAIPPNCLIPLGWKLDRGGIRKVIERRTGDTEEVRVATGAILPVAVHVDPDGLQLVELVWYDGRHWTSRIVSGSVVRSGKKLVSELGDAGLPTTESTAKDVEKFLAAFEALNRRAIPEKRIARWLGWQADGSFISTFDGEPRVEPRFPEYQDKALRAHRAHGTLEGWQATVGLIEKLPTAKMVLYASLASTLLDVLGINSFAVDIAGLSTRGKTTAGRIGVSCWADPRKDGGGFSTWQAASMYTVEGRLNLVRGLPVLMDETQLIDPRKIDVGKVLYSIGMNEGGTRGSGFFNKLAWSCIVIMTGERAATSYTTQQGTSARVLSLSEPPFGDATPENKAVADAVDQKIDQHFGHAGPLFAQRLCELISSPKGKADLRERHSKFAEAFRGTTDMSGRRAPLVAAIALAAALCDEWRLTPGLSVPDPEVWLRLFVTGDDPADNRPKVALEAAIEWVASHDSAIWDPKSNRDSPAQGWIGRTSEWEGKPTVAVLTSALKNALFRHNEIILAAVLPAWKNQGWIIERRKGDKGYEAGHPFDPKQRIGGKAAARMFTFAPDVINPSEGGEPASWTPSAVAHGSQQ